MISLQSYLGFAGAAALLLALPGPTNALLMAAGAAQSLRRTLPLLLAELAAYGLSIAPLLAFHEMLGAWRVVGGMALKGLAVAIILMLAYRLWVSRADAGGRGELVTRASIFWVTLFNPKGLIFAFAIFPPIGDTTDLAIKALLFVILTVLAGGVWIMAGAAILSRARHRLGIGKVAAVVLCVFALYLGATVIADAATLFEPGA
jgi:threonine/homoserine/homoserine lactone efflux protein